MSKAKDGDTVKVHYTGKMEDGTVFDSSVKNDPLQFTIGVGRLIPGFEQAVIGMQPGEAKTETISPEQAYGPRREDLVLEVDRNIMPDELEPEVGQQLQMNSKDGKKTTVYVTGVSDKKVELDANHPLAGKALVFDIELVEIV